MKLDVDKIRKEVESESLDHLYTVRYGGDKLLESIKNVADMVLLEYGIKESYIDVSFSSDGNIKITGVEKTIEEYNNE